MLLALRNPAPPLQPADNHGKQHFNGMETMPGGHIKIELFVMYHYEIATDWAPRGTARAPNRWSDPAPSW